MNPARGGALLALVLPAAVMAMLLTSAFVARPAGILTTPLTGLELRLVPAGSAVLGDRTGVDREHPARSVTFARPFWIGECEVTQAQWRAVMGSDPSIVTGDDLPVERVSWYDCQEFLARLGTRDGRAYRLPRADEWEYARRAGSSALPVADEERAFAAAAGRYVHRRALDPAASCPANAWGLRGMEGNAWEWVADSDATYPERRLMCGGSCNMVPRWCRPEARLCYPPDFIHERRGLRIALDAE
ncbi:MAG: SUMF1/EgtB/PvdO family nonheme iron enzyme [Planctomycetes bacterium]|nr:SUMF1/EgtB/PvdO family nonheme iron enzyme [Planctomycetota bacterium]